MKTTLSTLHSGLALTILSVFSLLTDHASDVTNRVSAIHVPGASKVFKARIGADGAIHLLFDGEDGPFYARSQDDGRTFGPPMAIVDVASKEPGLELRLVSAARVIYVSLGASPSSPFCRAQRP